MMLEPLGEIGAIFSLQLSSRTQFTKINNKKVIAENQCEKHKKSSLVIGDLVSLIFKYEKSGLHQDLQCLLLLHFMPFCQVDQF